FLANTFHGATKFDLVGVGPVWVRIAPAAAPAASAPEETRTARLARAVREGRAIFRLEVQLAHGPKDWAPLAEIRLTAPFDCDQQALQFNPIRGGRGLEARGFIQALRNSVYIASQKGRALSEKRALEAAPTKGILGGIDK